MNSRLIFGGIINLIISSSMVLIFFCSCFRQKASQNAIPNPSNIPYRERFDSCSDTTLLNNLILRGNLERLFLCTEWNQRFPYLFQALQNIDPKIWDDTFSDLNENVFSDAAKLKKIISLTRSLNEKDKLTSLESIMATFYKFNIFDVLFTLFHCSRSRECEYPHFIHEETIKRILRMIKIDTSALENIINFFDNVILALVNNPLPKRGYPFDIDDIVDTVDRIFNLILDPKNAPYLRILQSVLYIDEDNNISELLKKDGIQTSVIDMAQTISSKETTLYKDIIAALKIIKGGPIVCGSEEQGFQIIPETYLGMQISKIQESNFEDFYLFLTEELVLSSYASVLCPQAYEFNIPISVQGGHIYHKLNTGTFKESLLQLFSTHGSFEIIKYLVTASESSGQPSDENISETFALLLDDFFTETSNVAMVPSTQIKNHLPQILSIAASLNTSIYSSLSQVLRYLYDENNADLLLSLKNLWFSFSRQSKVTLAQIVYGHFKKDVDSALIFSFYNEILKVLKQDIVSFLNKISTSEDLIFDSILEISHKLRGESVLSDMRFFFSREHIIRILNLLSSNDNEANNDLLPTSINHNRKEDNDIIIKNISNTFVDCVQKIKENGYDFFSIYEKNINTICPNIATEGTGLLLHWFYQVDSLLPHLRSGSKFFDEQGIFSSHFGRPTFTNFKIVGSILEQQNLHWEDAITLWRNQLHNSSLGNFIKALMKGIVDLLDNEDGLLFRQRLYSLPNHNVSLRRDISDIIGLLPKIFRDWHTFRQKYTYAEYNPQALSFKCRNYHNQNISNNPCPRISVLLNKLEESLTMLITSDASNEATLLHNLLLGFSGGQGAVMEPRQRYRLTLQETAELLDNSMDRTLAANQKVISYINTKFEKSSEEVTILESIEGVIRESDISSNSFALTQIKHIYQYNHYDATIIRSERLLRACIFIRYCGSWLGKEQYRKSKNLLGFFPALRDLQGHDEYIKTLLEAFLASSPDIPGDRVLTNMASLSFFTNMARFLQDRVARNVHERNAFFESKDLEFLSQEFLKNININLLEDKISSIITNILAVRNNAGQSLLEAAIWGIRDSPYETLRELEDTLANALIVAHYLGPLRSKEKNTFLDNSIETFFFIADKIIQKWPIFTSLTHRGFNVSEYIRSFNMGLRFLKSKLHDEGSHEHYYNFINKIFSVLKKVLALHSHNYNIVDIYNQNAHINTKNFYDILEKAQALQIDTDILGNLIETVLNKDIRLKEYLAYLYFVSQEFICSDLSDRCRNQHFDEPYSILKLALENFDKILENIFNNRERISDILNRVWSYFDLKKLPNGRYNSQ